jgi:hypothetical protein
VEISDAGSSTRPVMKALVLFALAVAALRVTPIDATPTVQYADGRLTADLRDAELADVLGEVARQARLEVRGTLTAQRLSLRLEAVPLVDALPRLLDKQSFVLTYDRAGELKGVRFLGSSTAPWSVPVPETTGSTPEVEQSGSLAASYRSVEVSGLLASALGAEVTDFSTIMGVALQSGDARLRADALRVGLRVLDAEPELRADVLRTLDGLDDAFLAGWLTQVARDHAEEVARRTARMARSRPLRRRAAAVVRLLRSSESAVGTAGDN